MRHRFQRPLLAALALMAVMLVPAACGDGSTGPGKGTDAEMMLTASVIGTPIATLVVEVTAADIAVPIVTNLTVANGIATGTLRMPPGEARTITVRAFDSSGEVTHEGSKTIDVQRGNGNPAVSVPMVARSGHVDITIQVGPVSLVVAPASSAVEVGLTTQMTATVTAPNGEVLDVTPQWATTNPAFATVNGSGLVTGVREGSASIVASYAGVAAIAQVTVLPFGQPTANAGADFLTDIGQGLSIALVGSGSDPNGDALTYTWTLRFTSAGITAPATLTGAMPSFAAPDAVGTIEYDLVVSDGNSESAADRVVINAVVNAARTVWVSPAGNDANAGTQGAPRRTISAGIALAGTLGAGAGVYVAGGTYETATLELADDVSIYGGYDAATWRRDVSAHQSVIPQTVRGTGATGVVLDGIRVHAPSPPGPAASSYGILLTAGSAVSVNNAVVVASNGNPGTAGANGANGLAVPAAAQGVAGCLGCAGGGQGGAGGAGPNAGGAGGMGGYGTLGQTGTASPGGANGGSGSSPTSCLASGAPGLAGQAGAPGANGAHGFAAAPGVFSAAGYVAGNGTSGTQGADGDGGGGGGGSGGKFSEFVVCAASRGAGGGAGGSGGLAGGPGGGGSGGGASIAVYVHASSLVITNSSITAGNGGAGGNGGQAGASSAPTPGGSGGAGPELATGGSGGNGGAAGTSGSGAAGRGGPSIGIMRDGSSSLSETAVTTTVGTGGAGGLSFGGAPSGTPGMSVPRYIAP